MDIWTHGARYYDGNSTDLWSNAVCLGDDFPNTMSMLEAIFAMEERLNAQKQQQRRERLEQESGAATTTSLQEDSKVETSGVQDTVTLVEGGAAKVEAGGGSAGADNPLGKSKSK